MSRTYFHDKTVLLLSFLLLTVGLHGQTHFTKVWSGNGVDHMNINIVTAQINSTDLQVGDEIGIFDGNMCVGVGILTAPLSVTNILPVAVSRDDGTGNGYTVGNDISFKFWDQSEGTELSPVTPVYYTNNPTWSSNGKFAIGATAFTDLDATVSSVPETLAVTNETLISGEENCYNATQTITVAGGGTSVVFEHGSTATLIAGQSIRFLPGFHAQNGSWMEAHITTNGTFCDVASGSIVQQPQPEKSGDVNETYTPEQVLDNEKSFKVYPNPNNGRFTVELKNFDGNTEVCVYNTLGKRIYQTAGIANNSRYEITLPETTQGIYLVKVNSGNMVQFMKRIIVTK